MSIMCLCYKSGTVQIQERQKTVEKIRENELDSVRDLLHRHVREQPLTNQVSDHKGHNNVWQNVCKKTFEFEFCFVLRC